MMDEAMQKPRGLSCTMLGGTHPFYSGSLPEELAVTGAGFEDLWAMHPDEYHEIQMHGRRVKTPRWQQAYGRDYHYTGRTNKALPVPEHLEPHLEWAKSQVDARLNGLLLNWYDGTLGHYIGKHRDSTNGMVSGSPIVTMSLGEERVFRLRPWRVAGTYIDFPAAHGSVFVMPCETNLAWTHEVPHRMKYQGPRISITVRAFAGPAPQSEVA